MTHTITPEKSSHASHIFSETVEKIAAQLMEQGFFHRMELFSNLHQVYSNDEIQEFKNSWNNLQLDAYLGPNEKYRSRRICKMHAFHGGLEMVHIEDCGFFQDGDTNKKLGGIQRVYARSEQAFLYSRLLEGIVQADLAILNHALGARNWLVTCHQFRIHCDVHHIGQVTPEGIHSDGHDYVAQHFIGRHDVDGGESRIYDGERNLLKVRKLQAFLETLMLDDRRVLHDVAPITRRDGNFNNMYRDMLVVDFDALN